MDAQGFKDAIGYTAILVTIVLGSLTGVVAIYQDVYPVAALAIAFID